MSAIDLPKHIDVLVESGAADGALVRTERGDDVDWHDPEYGHRLWEYRDDAGDVRAYALAVPNMTPAWKLDAQAGDGEYREVSRAHAGRGIMSVLRADGYLEVQIVDATKDEAVEVRAGDTFQYYCTSVGELVMVGVNPGPPFRDEYESRVDSLFPPLAQTE